MNELTKITIVTISYNSEKTIERTIQSVISQKYDNTEYWIIDGKSTDSTMKIVKEYAEKYDFIKYISEKDNGISDAFNKGIKKSTGELIIKIFMPITNATVNILTAIVSDKYYPQYKKGYGKISKEELKNIKKQVIGLLAQRLAHTSRNALDNIIISSYFGLSLVAIYGNYFYVINALTGILAVLFTAMQAGIGNSVAKESAEKNYKDFSNINFLYLWIAGWCTVCFTCLIQPFMKVWVGEKLIFSIRIVFLLAFYFYAMKMTDSIGAFISATGLWWKCKWSYLFEAVVNLILNIGLGYYFGISGIIVATIISVIFVNYCSTVIILHKNYFIKYSIRRFFEKNFFYLVITCIVTIISFGIIDKLYNEFIHYNSMILELAFKALLCVGVPNIFFFLLFFSTKQFKEASKWLLHKIKYIHR